MATDFLPFDEWVAGTLQNSVPANSNALRSEAVIANVISDTLAAQPVSPADGDCYIIPAAATGTQWATFAEGSLAYFRAGTWYEFAAFEGLLKVVAGEIQIYSGTTWVPYAGGSAGSGGGGAVPVQEEGVTVVAAPTAINFVGAGATVTDVGGVATVTIPGGGGGGVTGWVSSDNTASPNDVVNAAQFLVDSASTNADAVITPKGTGAFQLQLATNTIAGGNKRGTGAIDLQLGRGGAAQVASGSNSIVIGRSNTASNSDSIAIGLSNTASGSSSVAIGTSTIAIGTSSVAIGNASRADSTDSFALAGARVNQQEAFGVGTGISTSSGISVAMRLWGSSLAPNRPYKESILRSLTTNATPATMVSNSSAASSTNQMILGTFDNSGLLVSGFVIARRTSTSSETKSWKFEAHLNRVSAVLSVVGTVTPVVIADSGVPWSISVTANSAQRALQVEVTGEAAKNIEWACYVSAIGVPG